MDPVTRITVDILRDMVDVPDFDELPDDALAAWARLARPVARDLIARIDSQRAAG